MSTTGLTPSWLWITPELTTTPSTGGLVYSHALLEAVANQGVDVTAVGLGRAEASELALSSPGSITWLPIPNTTRPVARTLLSALPHAAAKTSTRTFRRSVRMLLSEPWDVIVIDGIQSAWVTALLGSSRSGSRIVYIAQNHETSMRSEIASAEGSLTRRLVLRFDAWRTARLESATVEACDVVSAITAADRDRFAAQSSETSYVVVPPGWSGHPRTVVPSIAARPRRVGILGSFDWHVKQEGLRRFLTAADPAFAAAGCELVIGGRVPDGFRNGVEPDVQATRFLGWVDDHGEFLDSCRIGVVSESLGGGFKLKALDYIFNHVPLACLAHCAAGLPLVDGASMCAADDEAGLVARIIELIDDPEKLEQIADTAYLESVAVFAWSSSASRLIDAAQRP